MAPLPAEVDLARRTADVSVDGTLVGSLGLTSPPTSALEVQVGLPWIVSDGNVRVHIDDVTFDVLP